MIWSSLRLNSILSLFLLRILSGIFSSLELQMRLTWVSGDKEPQQVKYGDGKSQTSDVTTFSADDMCSEFRIGTLFMRASFV